MKAVFQNTIAGLLGLASVVLAAPTQFNSHTQHNPNTQIPAFSETKCLENECINGCRAQKTSTPSLEEGTIRFACY